MSPAPEPGIAAERIEMLIGRAMVTRAIAAVALETGRTPREVRERLQAWAAEGSGGDGA